MGQPAPPQGKSKRFSPIVSWVTLICLSLCSFLFLVILLVPAENLLVLLLDRLEQGGIRVGSVQMRFCGWLAAYCYPTNQSAHDRPFFSFLCFFDLGGAQALAGIWTHRYIRSAENGRQRHSDTQVPSSLASLACLAFPFYLDQVPYDKGNPSLDRRRTRLKTLTRR